MSNHEGPWEPDRSKMGNWEAMFQQRRQGAESLATPDSQPTVVSGAESDDTVASSAYVPQTYKPWLVQRGRSQPALMLGLRRYDAKSGLWHGWALAYPSLQAVETLGDRMLSLDFGTRLFMLHGNGLDQLAADLQRGVVLGIVEYSSLQWPELPDGPVITRVDPLDSGQAKFGG